MKEHAVLLGKTRSLVAIVTDPPEAERARNVPAFIFLNSGLIHRVGPNRLTVNMARAVAARGFVSCRLDFSGIGDSTARSDRASIMERWVGETQEAIDYVTEARGVDRCILVGNCSGAFIALKTACSDPRVVGTALMGLPGERTLMRYYCRLALSNPKVWLRTIRGRVKYAWFAESIGALLRGLRTQKKEDISGAGSLTADLGLLTERGIDVLLVYAEWDTGLDFFRRYYSKVIERSQADGKTRVEIIPGMNHTYDLRWAQEHIIETVDEWAVQIAQQHLSEGQLTISGRENSLKERSFAPAQHKGSTPVIDHR